MHAYKQTYACTCTHLYTGMHTLVHGHTHTGTYIKYILINTGTHQIDNFQTSERNGHLNVTISYADSMEERSGGYLMLLNCQTSQCNSFNYSNSIFLPTRNAREVMIHHGSYYSGMYKIFVFDTNPDGSIASSAGINSAYSLPPKIISLTMGTLSGTMCYYNKGYTRGNNKDLYRLIVNHNRCPNYIVK